MTSNNHLEVFDLVLTAKSPIFIGDGNVTLKKNYIFSKSENKVYILKEKEFFRLLLERGLVDQYEVYLLGKAQNDLERFLTNNRVDKSDWIKTVRYSMSVDGALDEDHSLKEIHRFIRNNSGNVYVPGSSIKGMLRTVILHYLIKTQGKIFCKDDEIEQTYFNKLNLNSKKNNAVNSIMRGISVSDSLTVDDRNITLFMKMDAAIDGNLSTINLCREGIKPGTELDFKLTLDQSILKNRITSAWLKEAINDYDDYYQKTFLSKFDEPYNLAVDYDKPYVVLGGGSGFFSKTIVYQYYGEKEGLEKTAKNMERMFKKHYHEYDVSDEISPHIMKYTSYNGQIYPIGLCGVKIR